MMRDTQALVTGASGFIGSRLVERLGDMGVRVRALVRHGVVAYHASDLRCEYIRGDVTEPDSLQRAVAGCDVIFHCAWGGMSLTEARRINVQGTAHILEASARARVCRVVHLSSMAVHGRRLPNLLTEAHPLQCHGDAYTVSKAEGERLALQFGESHGVEVVVLRPTLVYGPRSPIWLLGYFNRVKYEHLALINGGSGLANLVYVDDLIDAMWAAAQQPGLAGQAFLISGASPVTWRDYIGSLARMCRKPMPPSVPLWRAHLQVQWLRGYAALTQRPRRIQAMDLSLMTEHAVVSIEKAQRMLGYRPQISLNVGMQRAEAWLRHEGHLPPLAMTKQAVRIAAHNGSIR